jgi:hypothetical protein
MGKPSIFKTITMRIILIGHARHGKDTTASLLSKYCGFEFESSSEAASRLFLYDALKKKYGYKTPKECFEDRVNHRAEWHDLICEYNKYDKARLAREIFREFDIYVGMRSSEELAECRTQGLIDFVLGVYDPRKPEESKDSFPMDFWKESDLIISNSGTLEDLDKKIRILQNLFL